MVEESSESMGMGAPPPSSCDLMLIFWKSESMSIPAKGIAGCHLFPSCAAVGCGGNKGVYGSAVCAKRIFGDDYGLFYDTCTLLEEKRKMAVLK